MKHAGLHTTEGGAIPLRGVEAEAEVFVAHARVRLRQRYVHDGARPVEAVYVFPLPSGAAVVGFAMTCAGRRVEGEAREREAAFTAYGDAVAAGHGAALLERERPDVFTASVGNVLPGEETVVEVEYLERVTVDEGAVRWVLPTVVAPRYVPGAPGGERTGHGAAEPTDRVPDADRISPPLSAAATYGLRLDVRFELGGDLVVESPSHAIAVTREGAVTRASFRRGEEILDRDVVVTARGASASPLVGVAAHRAPWSQGYLALGVVPDLLPLAGEGARPGQRVVFVLDTSGSMAGASIVEARAALRLCLRHLREGDRFDVIEFNSRWRAFAPEPVAYSQASLDEADAWVAALRPDGGTELRAALVRAMELAEGGVVVLLTDGQVGNGDEVLAAALAARRGARVLSFGVGTSVSDALLRDLARHTGGAVEAIHPGERIDAKVVAQFARAHSPRVTGVTVRFAGADVIEMAPSTPPDLVDGEPWAVFAKYVPARAAVAEIRGTLSGAPFALDVPLDLPETASRPALPKLWASERIRDLEAGAADPRRPDAALRERVVALAVEHGVASRFTSFVVVEKRAGERLATDAPETVAVPVHPPAGWAMLDAKTPAPAPAQPSRPSGSGGRLGELLVRAKRISLAELRQAQDEQKRSGVHLGAALAKLGFINDREITSFLSQEYRTPSIDLSAVEIDPSLLGMLSRDVCEKHHVVPISKAGSSLIVAMSDPTNLHAIDDIKFLTGYNVEPVVASQVAIDEAVRKAAENGPGIFAGPTVDLDCLMGDVGDVEVVFPDGESDDGNRYELASPRASRASPPVADDAVVALLGRQLASGLWDDPAIAADVPVRRARVTARALLTLLDAGVTTSHPVHGAQVRKAVEALVALAPGIAVKAAAVARRALAVAWLAASGHRTRAAVEAAVRAHPALASLRHRLGDDAALRAWVDRDAAG